MVKEAIKKIEAQQKGRHKYSTVYQVGEQLKDICRSCPEQADLILKDLDNPAMSIVQAEKKIKKFADKHKQGNSSCCPPKEADKILRDFYGLAPASKEAPKPESSRVLDLTDFM